MERRLRFRPNQFEEEFWLIPIFCNKQKIAIDVGANMGSYSYSMQKYARRVIGFEPNIDLWPDLRRLLGRDFHLESAALSSGTYKATLRVDRGNTGISTIEEKNDLSCSDNKEAIVYRELETRTLDSFGFTEVSMIKIDVEGHEESVVAGAVETIRQNRPVFIIESEDRHNPGAPQRLADTFSKLDYKVFYIKDHRLMEFSSLLPEDTDPENLSRSGVPYIYNFVFIPGEQPSTIERARSHVAAR